MGGREREREGSKTARSSKIVYEHDLTYLHVPCWRDTELGQLTKTVPCHE